MVTPPPLKRAHDAPFRFSFVSGVIKRERVHAFELMLWRACRGNVFLRQAEIEEPLEDPVSVSAVAWVALGGRRNHALQPTEFVAVRMGSGDCLLSWITIIAIYIFCVRIMRM